MLIFDLDGTLWETIDTTLEAANIVADKYNLKTVTKQTVEKGMGLSSIQNTVNYMPEVDTNTALKYIAEICEVNFELIKQKGAHVYDGVDEVIKKLSQKYKLGIITNNYDEYVEAFFNVSGLKSYFTDYIGAASYKITKGEAIKKMVEKYNELNNYYIGDIKNDMIATMEAGISFVHARYGFDPNLECKLHIDDIKELENIVL